MLKIPVKGTLGTHWFETNSITRFEADGNYTWVFFADGSRALQTKTLKYYHELLHGHGFCRIHAKHLVNLEYVNSISKGRGGHVFLNDRSSVQVSYRWKPCFRHLFNMFCMTHLIKIGTQLI
jgi:two-component system LytT family response regulator